MPDWRFPVRFSKSLNYGLIVAILFIAASLRFLCLPHFPPGVEHDEVAEVLIAEGILQGHHALFFREAYGQEPLFLYLVAGALVVLGRNLLALRFVTASVGLLTVAAGARLARTLFDARVALMAAAGLGVMVWPVFWSRVGLRGMLLPLMMSLAADALWRALHGHARTMRYAWLSGLGWGLAMYTYLASRGIPILLISFPLYIALFDRRLLRRRWRELFVILAVTVLIAAPLFLYLQRNPEAQTRVYEVQTPLTALLQGDPVPILKNMTRVLGMFNLRGDSTERNNFPGRPVFPEPVWGGLFVIGVVVALLKISDMRYAFVLLWLGVMLSPTLVTTDAPNFVRALGALPVVMVFPGIGAAWLAMWMRVRGARWASGLRLTFAVVLGVAFVLNVGLTVRDYFVRWPQIPEVGFVWQRDFVAIAEWLDARPELCEVTVGGVSTTSMDAPSLDLLMKRDDLRVRWTDPGSPLGAGGAFVIPRDGGYFLIPSIVPLSHAIEQRLAERDVPATVYEHFTAFWIAPPSLLPPLVSFEGHVSLLEFSVAQHAWKAGETLTAFSTWQAQAGQHPALKAFVHLIAPDGQLAAQHDGLDSPAQFWRSGDRILQSHSIPLPADLPAGTYALRLGLYDRETLRAYRLLDGRDFVEIGTIDVSGH